MEDDNTKESGLATMSEELITIQTPVTLLVSASPISSQTLQRSSIQETPLQISRLSSNMPLSVGTT